MNYTQQQIDALIEGVYDGSITTRDLPVGLYNAISQKLLSALGSVEGKPSQSLLNQLSENIYMFSGAKVYQQIQDISLLANDETIKSFANFRDEALAIYDQYNKNWLETEYSTAIGQAQSAVRWEQVEAQKGELPFLQYSAVIDPNTSDICAPLDGICLPVDDPFWDINTPLNHFNCRCTVIQLDKTDATQTGITSKEDADKATVEITELRQPLFEGNSGKDRLIYNKEHPYFDVPKADREFAKENFGLPIPQLESLFTPAKTIQEAEAFAIKNELTASGNVNFEGMTIDTANITNKTLLESKVNDNLRFNSIKVNLKESSFAGLENNGLTLMKQSAMTDNEIAKIVSNDIGKVKFLNKKEYYSSSFEVIANKIKSGAENYSKSVAELTKELSIKHEISHLKQSFIKDASKGAFGDELKLSSKKWYSKWEKTIKSIEDNKGWHPSEYVKKWVYLDVREKEFFAESKTLFDFNVNLVKDQRIKTLLKEFDVIFNELKTKLQYNG